MRALDLDFIRRTRRWPLWGVVLLIAGAAVLAQVVKMERELAGRIDLSEAKLAALAHRGASPVATDDAQSVQQEIRQANDILRQLTLPWGALFKAVESSNDKEIALLAIAPDAQKLQVRLSGEAKHLKALLDYITRLEQSGAFDHVYLTNHEVKAQDPEKPVQFALVANWKLKP